MVLVYQMGKVASSSLCQALQQSGIDAAQAHFLGEAALITMLKTLLRPNTSNFFVDHIQGQLSLNITLTRRLHSTRRMIEQGTEPCEKAKVISLCRDPLDWYKAEFVQNFNGYIPAIRRFCGHSGEDGRSDTQCLLAAHQAMLTTMARLELGSVIQSSHHVHSLLRPAFAADGIEPLLRNAANFFRPVLWFQRMFRDPTGIDVYHDTPMRLSPGVLHYESSYCEALIVKYEQLHEAMPSIAHFVGRKSISMKRINVSERKTQYPQVKEAFQHLEIPQSLCDALYATQYSTLFEYLPRCRFQ